MGKLKLNKDGLKGFVINHVEKIVLVMVLLVFGVFVISSLGLEGLPSSQTPDVLLKTAIEAEAKINNAENSKEVLASVTVASGFRQRVVDGLIPTKTDLYAYDKPPSPFWGQDGLKRQDPALLPPEKVEVAAMTGPVAFRMEKLEDDQLVKEENSVQKPRTEPRRSSPKKKQDDMMGAYGMGMKGGGGKGDADGGMPGGMAGMAGMAAGGAMPGMTGMPGMMGDVGGMDSMGGMGVSGGPVMASFQSRKGFIPGQGAVARAQSCIAVKAVVPWKKQWEEYHQKFSTAMGYNPMRDAPRYLSFTAERLEVSDDPSAPLDWSLATKVAFTNKLKSEIQAAGYYGFTQEVADPRYLQYGVLTFPIPPFINRDPERLALHRDVPKLAQPEFDMEKWMKQVEEAKKKAKEKKPGDDSDDPVAAAAPGMMFGGRGADAGMGMSGMGMPGMDAGMGMAGMGMMPGMMPGGLPGDADSGMAGKGGMPGMGADAGMGMPGMGMMGMMGDSMGMGGMGMATGPTVPYLLVRFFDFSVEPGKKYRYRVQVILEDPNRPQYPQLEPSDRYMDDTVKKRLAQVVADEKNSKSKARACFLRTEWSEPSAPISLEVRPQAIAGHVLPVRVTASAEKSQDKVIVEEPTAKILSAVWNETFAVDVSAVNQVMRGTFLNFTADGDAIHPVYQIYKSLKKQDFTTNHLVADIRGGEELPGVDKQPLTSPGQYALVDDAGNLIVRSELDDWDHYQQLALPELPEMAGSFPGMEGGDGGAMGGMPGGMMPGMLPGDADSGMGQSGGKKRGKAGRGNRAVPGDN